MQTCGHMACIKLSTKKVRQNRVFICDLVRTNFLCGLKAADCSEVQARGDGPVCR